MSELTIFYMLGMFVGLIIGAVIGHALGYAKGRITALDAMSADAEPEGPVATWERIRQCGTSEGMPR